MTHSAVKAARAQPSRSRASQSRSAPREGVCSLQQQIDNEVVNALIGRPVPEVRIHNNDDADARARGYHATAFTEGTDIHLRQGVFGLDHQLGPSVLAHELAHVIQSAPRNPHALSSEQAEREASGTADGHVTAGGAHPGPKEVLSQLHELASWVTHRRRVLGERGFGRRLSAGRGATALFADAAGTGKTLAAEVLASELGLDLYRIDLSGVVSKYVGETKKNLDRIFRAVEDANAVLFFDEADALFGERSEVRDSHDRYASSEISYLLQEMEAHDGVVILATNLRDNLDHAFIRRLALIVRLPFPEEEERRRIWQMVWPRQTPVRDDVDLDSLAAGHRLSGGQIKNAALCAAYPAAAEGGVVATEHLAGALRRDYENAGRSAPELELELAG